MNTYQHKLKFWPGIFALLLMMSFLDLTAQSVGINEDSSSPNAKSILDIKSMTKGILAPRMTTINRLGMGAGMSEAGMLVYDTDVDRYMFYNGSAWQKVGEGLWNEVGAGMQNAVDNVGIGGAPISNVSLRVAANASRAVLITNAGINDNFALKVANSAGTGLAVFSGSSSGGYPSTPAAIYGSGRDGAYGAFIAAYDAGTGVLAQSQGTGPALDAWAFGSGLAGKFRGGNVHILESLGIGVNPPLARLHVVSDVSTAGIFTGPSNTMLQVYNGSTYAGFIQAYGDDFYFGRTSGTGSVVLYNAGNYLNLENDGDVSIGGSSAVSNRLRVESSNTNPVIFSQVNYVGSTHVRAVQGISVPNDGYGYGGDFSGGSRGVYGYGNGGTYTGTVVGVYGTAGGSGSAGTRTGIYGTASGGATNWAGYFSSGNVYVSNDLRIGTTNGATGYKVSVGGKIMCEELKVQNSAGWPDYVFAHEYPLLPVPELEQYILEHSRLPGIPAASQIEVDGIEVGEMQKRMMEKIEELTLYIISQEKRIGELEKTIESQQR